MSETKIQDQKLTGFWKILLLIMTSVGIIMTINQIFMLKILGFMPLDNAFLYYLMAIFLPFAFIIFPKNRKIKWYDIVLFCIAFVIGIYFGLNGFKINQGAWEWYAPTIPTVFSIIMWILVIEAVRRTSGKALTIVCIIFSLFPLITGSMPGFLQGNGYSFLDLARMHILSRNSIAGMPLQVFGQLLIGFMIFGVVLKNSGCGDFFLNISIGLLGKNPGGPAKVACVSSALLGSMSGSVLTNVVTTGSMTIPAMIKTGYKPKYAGAIEACASTGATIMPPIMGAAAFVMANFLRVPYVTIIIAAIIPALLYFWGIYVQIDAYARRVGLVGFTDEEVPSVLETLKKGWFYIFAFVLLCYLLIILRVEGWAPYFTSLALIILASFRKETRINKEKLITIIREIGETLASLIATITAVGLILGALTVTGVALAFSRELVALVGNNAFLILISGALTSFILGMGMTATACYIFLAITMAPAIISMGFDPIATHLFIFYWGMISYITPPLALAVFAACGISKSKPMETGVTAVKMGIVAYFIPFLYIYNTALIAKGTLFEIAYSFIMAIIGIWIISSALEGYMLKVGLLPSKLIRIIFFISGLLIFIPETFTDIVGIVIAIVMIIITKKILKYNTIVEESKV